MHYHLSHQGSHLNDVLVLLAPCVLCLVIQLCPILCDTVDCSPPGSSVHVDSPGKNTGVGYCALLQGIFPTQGLKPMSLASAALVGRVFTTNATWEDQPLNKGTLQIQKSGISNLIETFSNGISSGS